MKYVTYIDDIIIIIIISSSNSTVVVVVVVVVVVPPVVVLVRTYVRTYICIFAYICEIFIIRKSVRKKRITIGRKIFQKRTI